MFAQANRLTKTKDIERLFKQGRAHYNQLLGVRAATNDLSRNRFTVIVNLKVSKKAVDRNRVKRQIRAGLQALCLPAGFDIAVICLPAIKGQTSPAIASALQEALRALKLLA